LELSRDKAICGSVLFLNGRSPSSWKRIDRQHGNTTVGGNNGQKKHYMRCARVRSRRRAKSYYLVEMMEISAPALEVVSERLRAEV